MKDPFTIVMSVLGSAAVVTVVMWLASTTVHATARKAGVPSRPVPTH